LDEGQILEQPILQKRQPPIDGIYEDTFYCFNISTKDDNADTWNPFECNDESYIDRYKFNPLLGTVEQE
jgi:hypothetical protein